MTLIRSLVNVAQAVTNRRAASDHDFRSNLAETASVSSTCITLNSSLHAFCATSSLSKPGERVLCGGAQNCEDGRREAASPGARSADQGRYISTHSFRSARTFAPGESAEESHECCSLVRCTSGWLPQADLISLQTRQFWCVQAQQPACSPLIQAHAQRHQHQLQLHHLRCVSIPQM